jgi:hypothetical protein
LRCYPTYDEGPWAVSSLKATSVESIIGALFVQRKIYLGLVLGQREFYKNTYR